MSTAAFERQHTNGHINGASENMYTDMDTISSVIAGIEDYAGQVVYEERPQIESVVAGIANRMPIAAGGPAGSSKSELLKAITNALGLDESDIATVQGTADITPTQLIGGRIDRQIRNGQGELDRIESNIIPGKISEDIRFLKIDEFPRLHFTAREALYPVLAERMLRSTDKNVPLLKLLGVMTTQNAAKAHQRLTVPEGSRFPVGALFDAEIEELQMKKFLAIANRTMKPQTVPELRATTNPDEFERVQRSLADNRNNKGEALTTMSTDNMRLGYLYASFIASIVREMSGGETESTSRMAVQMTQLARHYAVKNNSQPITEEHVLKAAQVMATARVIILSTDPDLKGNVDNAYKGLAHIGA